MFFFFSLGSLIFRSGPKNLQCIKKICFIFHLLRLWICFFKLFFCGAPKCLVLLLARCFMLFCTLTSLLSNRFAGKTHVLIFKIKGMMPQKENLFRYTCYHRIPKFKSGKELGDRPFRRTDWETEAKRD